MAADIIDGKKISEEIHQELAAEIDDLRQQHIHPRLAVILVGDDPASRVYVRMKSKACERLGIDSETILLPHSVSESELLERVETLNAEARTHGVLVQMPLPQHISANKVIEAILPEKDVDGFHPINKGRLQAGEACLKPCTPAGIHEMLLRRGFSPEGKHVVILGRSQIVGLPLALLLVQKQTGANATVTICHSRSQELARITRSADILIAAIGRPEFVKAELLSEHTVVIDVGVNRVEDAGNARGYRLAGDVDFETAKNIVKAITPVPGGVGPLTIAMLMKNTVIAAKLQNNVTAPVAQ